MWSMKLCDVHVFVNNIRDLNEMNFQDTHIPFTNNSQINPKQDGGYSGGE